MNTSYFSDREKGLRARTYEAISIRVWGAICSLIDTRLADGSLAKSYPITCPDGRGIYDADPSAFWRAARGEIPDLPDDIYPHDIPDVMAVLDLVQFCAKHVQLPIQRDFHSHFGHHHLEFDRANGLANFVSEVNLLFARNGVAFELTPEGIAQRLGPPGLREQLQQSIFHTGDAETDRLLEDARRRILSPKAADRSDAIEKLWDAFERIKTLEPGSNKNESAARLLDRSAPAGAPTFRQFLETEAKELTVIGNTLRIRHSETDKEPLQSLEQVDYLFHRLFALLLLLLRTTGRALQSSRAGV